MWSQIEKEEVGPQISRQVIHTGNLTVARIHFGRGATVPEHSHVHEQVTIVLTGRVKFISPDGEEIVEPGQVVHAAPDVPHRLEALEESLTIDVFTPRRNDWIYSGLPKTSTST